MRALNPSNNLVSVRVDANGYLMTSAGGTDLGSYIGDQYETVAASQTDQVLGGTGAAGDYLSMLTCVVATAATSQVSIKDGAGGAIIVLPANVGAGVGTYTVPLGLTSLSGAWKITTGAGVSVIASGRFTA